MIEDASAGNNLSDDKIIAQTANWIRSVVIGCNFCPFAAKAMNNESVKFIVQHGNDAENDFEDLLKEFIYLDEHPETETTLIILPTQYPDLYDYLDMIEEAENFLADHDYEGVYQIASFHPLYCFAGAAESDPANYTNRSPYPVIHVLREDSITKALEKFDHPEKIPDTNIAFAQNKGLAYMQMLRESCFTLPQK